MNVHQSVLKRERQNKVRRNRNRMIKSKVHTAKRRVLEAIHDKKQDDIKKLLSHFFCEIDKSVKRGVIHRNTAARNKSKLNNKVKDFLKQ